MIHVPSHWPEPCCEGLRTVRQAWGRRFMSGSCLRQVARITKVLRLLYNCRPMCLPTQKKPSPTANRRWMIGCPGDPLRTTTMPQKLMDVLMLGRCSHEFSWPRRAADGHYYQVCLVCAAEYKYDWKTMRRIKRVDSASETTSEMQRGRSVK